MMSCLDCNNVRVVSGDHNERFKVEFALLHTNEEEVGNYFLFPYEQDGGEFLLDLGCEDSFETVELVNTHHAERRTRSTKGFQVFLR